MQKRSNSGLSPAMHVALMGLLFAMAMVLSFVESFMLPSLPLGVKLGLSNIVTMYCLYFLGVGRGVIMAVLKAAFVALTRGGVAAAISLSGGLTSVLIMALLLMVLGRENSPLPVSIAGAVAHNLGQLLMVRLVVGTARVFTLLPLLAVSGLVMGAVTGLLLKAVAPHMNRIYRPVKRDENPSGDIQK